MNTQFFERPILNSPYEYPGRHWELDESGQPTSQVLDNRRHASFITPIPKPRKRSQREIVFEETARALETEGQQYDLMEVINDLRRRIDAWRAIPDPGKWRVTPETARLLQHWRGHRFGDIRPFFCQVESVETVIWLTEVAPGRRVHRRVRNAGGLRGQGGSRVRGARRGGDRQERSDMKATGQFDASVDGFDIDNSSRRLDLSTLEVEAPPLSSYRGRLTVAGQQ